MSISTAIPQQDFWSGDDSVCILFTFTRLIHDTTKMQHHKSRPKKCINPFVTELHSYTLWVCKSFSEINLCLRWWMNAYQSLSLFLGLFAFWLSLRWPPSVAFKCQMSARWACWYSHTLSHKFATRISICMSRIQARCPSAACTYIVST